MDEKQNIPSSQANAPRIYVVENNGKNRFLQATTDMEDDFIVSTFPSAKLATQQQQDEEAAKRKERGLIAPDLSDLSLDEGLFKFDEKVSQNENKTLKQQSLDRLTGQDLQDKANNALKNDFTKRRANDPLKVIEDDVNRYARKQKHLDELKQTSDFPTDENFMPKSVVDEIVSESSELQPDSERVVVDNNSRIPTIANSFLLANQEEYTSEHYVPTSADGPFVKTVSRHTAISPKLKREVVDWLNNTEMGQRVIQQEAEVLANLNQSIEEFKQKVESTLSKEYNNKDAVQAKKYLNEIEKIQNAYADKDRNAFIAGVKELGRRAPYALANTATVGILDMISAEKLFTASADGKNILTQEGLSLMHDIQNAYSQDTTIAQSIAKGVTDTMPFMAEFATTGAIVGKAAKAGGKLALKGLTRAGVNTARIMGKSTQLYNSSVLMRAASNIVKEPLSAGAKAFIMPSTFRNAIEDSAENNYSNFLDAYSKNWFINTLSNLSENMGKYIPEPKFADKFGWTKKIADATGMQGAFGEFVEENIETVLQAGFETGEAEWSDLIDPRNQAVTLGVVVALQLPFASIRAGAKASSVYRDKKQQYQINKGYKTNSANIITVLGKDYGAEVMQDIDDVINSIQDENELNDKLNAMLNNIAESNRLTYEGINAVRSYTQASVAKNAVIQAKQEEALGRDTEVKDMLTELANPENGMLQEVEILTEEDTFTVIKGNLVAGQEEGSIDFDNSSKEVYVKNPRTGEVLVIPSEQVKSILSSVPLDEAILQAQTAISEPIEADIANQVHYDEGRAVVFNGMDNQTYSGEIIGFNPETGNYIIAETVSMQQMEIEPRFIYPSTHLDGLEAGTEVRYIAEDGTEQIGIMDQNITSRDMLEGTTFVDGMQIPLDNILGKYVAKESTPFNEVVEEDTTIENQEQSDLDSTIEMQDEVEVDQAEEMKMTEQGQPDFYAVKPTTTLSYIADLLGNDSTLTSNYIVAQIKEAESEYKKLKEPTVSTDIFEYQKSIERFNAQKENTQSNLKYWNDVAVEFAKIGNADKAIVDIATSSVKDNLMKKIMSNTDLTNITDEKATELIDDISSIRKHAVLGAINLDQSELNNLNKIDQVLKAQGYEVPNLTDVEADDVISDINNQTVADGVQDADPNTVLNYFTNPIQLPILKNGQVIRKGLYDAEQRIANELVEIQKQIEEQARQEAEELETLTSEREKAFKVKAPVQLLENATEEDLQDIAESSTNPLEIFQAYYTALSYADDANLQQWERDLLGRKINPQSFLRFGDKNNVSGTIAKSWFVRRNKQSGYNNSTNLDIIAQELTETSGVEVTPQMIVDFILDNPSNYIKKQTQLTTDLNNRFRQVVQGMYGLKNINGIESNSAQNFINNFIVIMDNADLHSSETVNSLDPIKLSDTVASVLREIQFTELSSIEEAYQALDEVKESKFAGFPFTESDYNETINFLNNAEKINQEAVQRRGEELNESQTIRDVEPISQESQQPTQEEVIAYQESQVDQNPTEAQKEAGNYKKGHINIQGLDITIENPPGSVRSGTDVNGKAWSIEMKNPYGYIKRTMGADGDHVDVVYGKKLDSDDVYIFNQIKDDGSFDEHKVVIAASSEKSAKAMIQANYNKGAFKFDGMHKLTMSEFKKWLDNPQNTNKPFVPNTNPILVESVVELPQTETKPPKSDKKQGKTETKTKTVEAKENTFGKDNKFITNDKAEELRERIRKRLGSALMSGFDPELVKDCVMLAAYYVEGGARSFKDYSTNMLKDLGVGILPMLKSVYSWAKLDESIPAEIRKSMDSLDAVSEIDMDKVLKDFREEQKQESLSNKFKVNKEQQEIEANILADWAHNNGHEAIINRSRTKFGDSTYIYVNTKGEAAASYKFRISDHGVTSQERIDTEDLVSDADMAIRIIEAEIEDNIAKNKKIKEQNEKKKIDRKNYDDKWDEIKDNFKTKEFLSLKNTYQTPQDFKSKNKHAENILIVEEDKKQGYDRYSYYYTADAKLTSFGERQRPNLEKPSELYLNYLYDLDKEKTPSTETTVEVQTDLFGNPIEVEQPPKSKNKKTTEGALLTVVAPEDAEEHERAEVPAVKELAKKMNTLSKNLAKDLNLEHEKLKNDKNLYSHTNVPPAGGEATIKLYKPNGEGIVVQLRYTPTPSETGMDNLQLTGVEYALKNRDAKHQGFNTVNKSDLKDGYSFDQLKDLISRNLKLNENEKQPSKQGSDTNASNMVGDSPKDTHEPIQPRTDVPKTGDNKQDTTSPGVRTEDEIGDVKRGDRGSENTDTKSSVPTRNGTTDKPSDNRKPNDGNIEDTADAERVVRNTNNNVMTVKDYDFNSRGPKGKIEANIAAIELANTLIEENRQATPKEMKVLREYVGWGGLSNVFQNGNEYFSKIREIMSPEEYNEAFQSTTTAFYTPPTIVKLLWDIAEKLGFKGGNILEPSAGVGNILSLMPKSISENAQIETVELDKMSGKILSLLYPDAKTHIGGYETKGIKNNTQDMIITNVPFGQFKVFDKQDKDISTKFNIHDFFIAKSIRKLKPGGIGIFITSTGTLDSASRIREWIDTEGNADLIDAVRLNSETFKTSAGTEVSSDILIFRKRDINGKSEYAKEFRNTSVLREVDFNYLDKKGEPAVDHKAITINEYFANNPERMAGEMRLAFEDGRDGFRPFEQRLIAKDTDQEKVINKMIKSLPSDAYNPTPVETNDGNIKSIQYNTEKGVVKEGALTIQDGQPYMRVGDELVPIIHEDKDVRNALSFLTTKNKVKGFEKVEVLEDYLNLKDAVNNLLALENNSESADEEVEAARKELNKVYDKFYAKYGQLTNSSSLHFLKNDVDYNSLSAIENERRDKENNVIGYDKADIFSKRVINKYVEAKADNIEDAVTVSIIQNGTIDIPRISQLLGKTQEEVRKEILEKGIGFINPQTNMLEDKVTYLSGNVRQKLEIAESNNQDNEYNSNITALLGVMPVDIPLNAISVKMGSTWIPIEIYNDYFLETFGVRPNFYQSNTDQYMSELKGSGNPKDVTKGINESYPGSKLAIQGMNGKSVVITKTEYVGGKKKQVKDAELTAQAALKIEEINEDFSAWVRKLPDDKVQILENKYNHQYNSLVKPDFKADLIDRFPNASGSIVMLTPDGDTLRFRDVKEAHESDIQKTRTIAKELGIEFDEKTNIYSTNDRSKSDSFMKQVNGEAKILRQHQKDGVFRSLRGSTLLAHEVGTGKTLTLITTAMEMKRLGLANKPTIVVQKATLGQFVKEIKNQYPNARILVPTAKDLKASERENLYSKIAFNDWDIVVLYHSFLDSIPDDPKRVSAYISQIIQEKLDLMDDIKANATGGDAFILMNLKNEIETLEGQRNKLLNPEKTIVDGSDSQALINAPKSVKDKAKAKAKTEATIKKLLGRRTDNTMNFEQLGIDALLIDEAHNYKKLGFQTGLKNIKGIDTTASQKAQSTRLKTQWIKDNNNNRNVVFATGTPISNTMAEMWTFMRYLLPEAETERLSLNIFDSFVRNFGTIEEGAEFTTSGAFKLTSRFSSYANVPELLSVWEQVAHTVLTQEISSLRAGVGTPLLLNDKPTDIIIEQSKSLKQVMKMIKDKLEWYETLSGEEKKQNQHIPLVMFGLAKRATIDVRLVAPQLAEEENSKTNKAVEITLAKLDQMKDYRGTVAIFVDSFNSRDKSFNVYDEIKRKLVEKGVPENEIAIIHNYESDDKKVKLFEQVNMGDVRVVLGNTERLGVGVNIQQRLGTVIHLDAPTRPSDYQQRNGRIQRQGNKHLQWGIPIEIIRIGVKQTLDTTGYQRLAIKENFIRQIMEGDKSVRSLEDEDIEGGGGNFGETMALLSGSMSAVAIQLVRSKLRKLENKRDQHENSIEIYKRNVGNAKNQIKASKIKIKEFQDHIKEVDKYFGESKEIKELTIGKVTANTEEEIQKLLKSYIFDRYDALTEKVSKDKTPGIKLEMKVPLTINSIDGEFYAEISRTVSMEDNSTIFAPRMQRMSYLRLGPIGKNPLYVSNGSKSYEINETQPLIDIYLGANPTTLESDLIRATSNYLYTNAISSRKNQIVSAENVIKEQEHLIDQPFTKYDEITELQEQEKQLDEQIKKEVEEIAKRDKADAEELGTLDIELEIVEEEDKEEKTKKHIDYRKFKRPEKSRYDKLIKSLQSNGLALDIIFENEIPENVTKTLKTPYETIYGWVDDSNVVHLVEDRMNMNTPIHEFAHLWLDLLKKNNPQAWTAATQMIAVTHYFEDIDISSYDKLPLDEKLDEALALAIGDYGARNFKISKYPNLKDLFGRMFNSFKNMLGLKDQANIENMSLNKFLAHALKQLTTKNVNVEPSTNSEIIEEHHPNMSNSFHRDMLDKKLNRYIFKFNKSKFIENYQDRYAPVKDFLDYLRENGTPVAEYNDWYLKATHLFGQVDHAIEMYDKNLNQPMLNSVNALIKAKDIEYRDIENYVLIKHAVERNEYFKSKDEELGKKVRADYSGLIPMLEEVEYENAEAYIENFENGNETLIAELWTNINKSTNNSLKLLYDNGVLSKEVYEELKTRYKYYVPLRGHDEVTAEDRWADVYDSQGSRFNDALKVAKGRSSRATSPFANIYNINQSAISEAYKNKLNQSLLRLAKSDKTGLLKASSVWYERVGQQEDGTPIYEIRTPEYSENEDIRLKNEEEFEAKMLELEANQMAINSRTSRVDVGDMFIKPSQAKEHEVLVRQNGKMNVIYVNANPRVAKAINGTNVVDKGQALSTLSNVTRFMASLFTTKNPKFILTNASRDFIMASSMLIVKEGPKYQAKFFKNITKAMGALRRYNFGKPTADNKYDVYLNEFLMNGAKTGYSHFIELKRLQKNIEKDLKNNTVDGNKKLMRRLGDVFGAANDMAENYTRLSTYITSRQSGRSISRSVSDAKEVTLNFNRRGAGGGGILSSNVLTSAFVFFNVGLQAIDNFTKVAKANPKATAGLIAGFTSVGFLAPLVNSLLIGGGDDEDYDPMDVYFNIGQWERQNNFTVWTGNGFIKIPIAQELRVFYAMGDNLFLMASGRKDILDGVLDQFESFSDLIPNNPMGAVTASWAELVPEPLKPIAQIAANTKFTGSPIFNDKYNNEAFSQWSQARTTKNGDTYAPAFIVGLTKALDYMSGGDGVQKGAIDINPDKLDHLLGGYLGGVYRMFAQGVDAAYKTAHNITSNEEDILHTRIKDLPINSFYTSKDELRYISDHEAEQYYDIRSKTEQGLALIKKYAQNAVLSDGGITDEELESQLEALNITRDVLPLLYSRVKAIQKISKSMAYFEKDSKDKAEREIAKIQKQTIEIFNNLNNIKEDENLATEYEDIEIDEFKVKE